MEITDILKGKTEDWVKWLIQTTDFHGVGTTIGIRLNPEDIHIMHKSEYSGMFGDYSSYSAEYDELTEDAEDEEE